MLTAIITTILEWLLEKLVSWGLIAHERSVKDSADEKVAQDDAERLKAAQNAKEKEDAAKAINDHTFGS